jgi:hypothetical protein
MIPSNPTTDDASNPKSQTGSATVILPQHTKRRKEQKQKHFFF